MLDASSTAPAGRSRTARPHAGSETNTRSRRRPNRSTNGPRRSKRSRRMTTDGADTQHSLKRASRKLTLSSRPSPGGRECSPSILPTTLACPKNTSASGWARIDASCHSSLRGSQMSSAPHIATKSPCAAANAVLKAAGQPPLARRITRIRPRKRSSSRRRRRSISSSTTTTSQAVRVWPRIDSRASAIHSSAW